MQSSRRQTLEATASLSLLLLILYLLWFPIRELVISSAAVLLLGLFSVPPIPWLLRQWMRLLHLLGIINTKILLALIFFVVLTPLAWIYRLFNKEKPKENTNFTPRHHTFSASDFENPF
ncbi:SxtJ family membrane protein [Rufibacter roseus]|uniref:SxtJ family membrane protein n=1 Tax=Rufibacter roseus TaxID=1567108 RepID=A0ABW2DNI5_9BACT|nr:SxtJ family membrane protein [Rufibacter roseus]